MHKPIYVKINEPRVLSLARWGDLKVLLVTCATASHLAYTGEADQVACIRSAAIYIPI